MGDQIEPTYIELYAKSTTMRSTMLKLESKLKSWPRLDVDIMSTFFKGHFEEKMVELMRRAPL